MALDLADQDRSLRETARNGTSSLARSSAGRSSGDSTEGGLPDSVAEPIRYLLARRGSAHETPLPRRIAVVAALPGEGVTTVSRALAVQLTTDDDVSTCWVDLHARSGGGENHDNGSHRPGIYDVMIGDCDLDAAISSAGPVAKLSFGRIPAGREHRSATSQRLDAVLGEVADRFDHVVFDVPALLTGSISIPLLRFADAQLLVIRHGVTTMEQASAALDRLDGIESIGVVLNQARVRTPRPLSRWLATSR